MDDLKKKSATEGGDKEILYSKAIKAGKRIYYLDVKRNQKDDLFVAITESKKVQSKESTTISFEKHKIFLYKEDFDKFIEGMADVVAYIREIQKEDEFIVKESDTDDIELKPVNIKLDYDF